MLKIVVNSNPKGGNARRLEDPFSSHTKIYKITMYCKGLEPNQNICVVLV